MLFFQLNRRKFFNICKKQRFFVIFLQKRLVFYCFVVYTVIKHDFNQEVCYDFKTIFPLCRPTE